MAINLGDIITFIRADQSKLKGDLADAKGDVDKWGSGLASSVKGFVGGAVLGGVTALGAAVAGVGVAAFNTATSLDDATDKMVAQLGTTAAGAENYRASLESVFGQNYGDSIDDVAQSLVDVEMAFKRIGGSQGAGELEGATKAALALRDAFDIEVNESASAAVELMDQFGLSAEQAYDFIAKGQQKGLNAQGDFLDTIGEYSTQFANGGASAEQFFSIIETGMQGGMLGTDKAADAFKEFRVRIEDGSDLTAQSLEQLGLNSEKILGGLSNGSLQAIDVFDMVTKAISETENSTLRFQAGVGLLGTQFEDLGDAAVSGLNSGQTTLDEMAGSIDKLNRQYDNLPSFFEGIKRRALLAIAPIGAGMLAVFNEALPTIEEMFTRLETAVKGFIASSTFTWEPDFKQIKLGDLFEWVTASGVTQLSLGDFFDLTTTPEFTTFTLGDFFTFATDAGKTEIDIGDYVSFVYDKSSGGVALTLGDVFTFTSGDLGTSFNLGDYLSFFYQEDEKFTLKIGDVYSLVEDENGSTINLADWLVVSYDPSGGLTELSAGDFFSINNDAKKQVVKVGDFYEVVKEDDTTKYTLDATWFFGTSASDAIQIKVSEFFDFSIPPEMRLGIKDFFSFGGGEDGADGKVTQVQLFDLQAKAPVGGYALNDFFDWMTGTSDQEVKLTIGDLFDFSLGTKEGIVKLKIGDFFDAEDTSLSGLFEQAAATLNVAPEWVTQLQTFLWPGLPWADKLDTLLAWVWPDAPQTITDVLAWVWPDFGLELTAIIGRVTAFTWPDFGAALTTIINNIIAFEWPELTIPQWISDLKTFTIPTPGWVNRLLSWTQPEITTPSVDSPDVDSGGSIGGTGEVTAGSAKGLQRSGVTIYIENAYMNTRQDLELLANTIVRKQAYR